jgi:hypothetical protein
MAPTGLVGDMDCRIKSGNDGLDANSWCEMIQLDRIKR